MRRPASSHQQAAEWPAATALTRLAAGWF